MNIDILTYLQDNPVKHGKSMNFEIRGISLNEIQQLEQSYNNGAAFPKALTELLYLGGDFCYVLTKGQYDTQQEMQEISREKLLEFNKKIIRPFFVIDVYNSSEQFLFVYLDEGDNPYVYQAYLPTLDYLPPITNLDKKLSEYINFLIDKVKKGFNPF